MDNATGERRTPRSLVAEAAFRSRLAQLGAELLDSDWLGGGARYRARCVGGHDCFAVPREVARGKGICRACVGSDPATAEAAFRARLAELGAELLEPAWLGSSVPHRVRCAAGHECRPRPASVRDGCGPCGACGRAKATATRGQRRGRGSIAAEERFRRRLEELGAKLLEPEWRGAMRPHHVRCRAGHDCLPAPVSVNSGQGICLRCARRSPADAETAFCNRLAELGAEQLEPYVNCKTRVHVRCAAGHDCHVLPNGLTTRGRGICRVCARNDPATAERSFRARLAEMGATPLYDAWLGNQHPYPVRCANGHDCNPRPNDVQQGDGICRVCAGTDPATAEAAFIRRLEEAGAVPLYKTWRGTKTPHRVRCKNGHECSPQPTCVIQGQGPCFACAHSGEWDVFYVVASGGAVKFGITTGDPRRRLSAHARAGLTQVLRVVTGLPDGVAHEAEAAVRSALADAGEKPLRGREYFDISCLAIVLDVADSWLSVPRAAAA